ncbi:galactonate dehydratase [Parapedobacter pyrenivorans]|uniref:galactonate dehydratase n=1 Tax=Parapedobacter pyrenivorans TaxID=1305674 RepID=UPI0033404E6C
MRISKIELFKVQPRWLFLRLETETGLVGWGEPVVEGKADTVAAAVNEMCPLLLGKEAGGIEDIWQMLYRGGFYRGGPVLMSAISGIDQALWDIKGKALGVPVYELLGGAVRTKMKVYGWIGGDRPSELVATAKRRLEQGFTAFKMNACGEMEWIADVKSIERAVASIAAVREALGTSVDLAVDFHGRVHKGSAKRMVKELEPLKLMFIEEPLLFENMEALPDLVCHTTASIALGERLFSRWDFKRIFEQRTVDIVQPDLSHAGGISEVRRIAAMAEAYDVALAPHCPLGPISFASALQVDFSSINAVIQETSMGIHYNEEADLLDYLLNPEVFDVKEGFVDRSTLPGLGILIDEDKVRRAAETGHCWKNPIWRNADGAITEW